MRSIVLFSLALAGGAMADLSNTSSTSTGKASTSDQADVDTTSTRGELRHSQHSHHHHNHHHLHAIHESIIEEPSRETAAATSTRDEMDKRQVTPCNPLDPRCWEEKRAQISAATAAAADFDNTIHVLHRPTAADVHSIVTKVITQTITHLALPQLRHPMVTPAIRYWPTIAHISGANHTITAPTQTIGNQVFVADPLMKYKLYDPDSHPHAPTGACKRDERKWENEDYQQDHASHWDNHEKHFWNKIRLVSDKRKPSECEIERCMWHYMKPMTITTAAVYAYNDGTTQAHNWFTQETFLRKPHWGTHHAHGIYYPLTVTHDFVNNTAHYYPARHTPTTLPANKIVHEVPRCLCAESCYHDVCTRKREADGLFNSWTMLALALVILFILLPLAAVILGIFLKRRRDARKPDPAAKQSAVVNNATAPTEVRNAAGDTVGPTEKGTLGRRAEEGRAVGSGTGTGAAGATAATAPPGTVGRQAEEARAAGVTSNAAGTGSAPVAVQEAHPETHVVSGAGEAPQPVHNNA